MALVGASVDQEVRHAGLLSPDSAPFATPTVTNGFPCKLQPMSEKRKGYRIFLMAFPRLGWSAAAGLLVLLEYRV
jgi:hypothetical protein